MDDKNESNPFKIYKLGEEELEHRTNLKLKTKAVQDYDALKTQFKARGNEFQDVEFPPSDESFGKPHFCSKLIEDANKLYKTKGFGEFYKIEWGRVKDIIAQETIITKDDTAEKFNDHTLTFSNGNFQISVPHIKRGLIESGWLITAITAIADLNSSECIDEIVPKDNLNDGGTGVYHFRFWYQGCKVDVVVDDYVPFLRSEQGFLLCGAPFIKFDSNILEFWICLAEKAFAKLLGSYQTLGTGTAAFSGLEFMGCGFLQILDLGQLEDFDAPLNCYDQLAESFTKDQSVVTLDCGPKYRYTQEFISKDGLICGLTYILKGVYEITNPQPIGPSKEKVVKIRCPGGGDKSMTWKGEWSDEPNQGANLWDKISSEEKKSVGYDENANDIFWMSYDNMLRYFRRIDVCLYITMQKLVELESQNTRLLIVHGAFGVNDAIYELNVGESPRLPNVGLIILGFSFKMGLDEKPSPVDLKVYKVNTPTTEKISKSSIWNVLIGVIMKSFTILESIVCFPCQTTNKIETVSPVEIKPIDGSTKQLELGYKSLSFGYKVEELGKHKIIISYKNSRRCNQKFVLKVIYTRPKKQGSSKANEINVPRNLPEEIGSGTESKKEQLETIPKSQESTEPESKELGKNTINEDASVKEEIENSSSPEMDESKESESPLESTSGG